MLLVIVGAGASYDSIPSRPPRLAGADLEQLRPPLADQLFEPRALFERIMRFMPQVMQVAPRLMNRPNGESVEDVLEKFAEDAAGYPDGKIQLAAIRFYLQGIITQCEDGWYREKQVPTNLMGLIDQIERARKRRDPPIFVTFNYDRLIESALENRSGRRFAAMRDYILGGSANVIKLHGSVDWARPIEPFDHTRFSAASWPLAKEIADQFETLGKGGAIQHTEVFPTVRLDTHIAIPAIAIPVKAKSDFECPEDHIGLLKGVLPRVRTILTIGWRGAERHFLKLLRESGLPPVEGICVAWGTGEAEQTAQNLLEGGVRGHFEPYNDGFTSFVSTQKIVRLLNITWP